jgi:hypothetical protein
MGVQDRPRLSQADLKALTDARVGLVKAALQLSPEQEKYWPALEGAIRTRSTGRQQRLAALADRLNQQRDVEPLELLRERANNLAQRSAELKKLVDAWQPLWQTLNPRPEAAAGHPRNACTSRSEKRGGSSSNGNVRRRRRPGLMRAAAAVSCFGLRQKCGGPRT